MAHVAPVKKRLVEDLASRCAKAQVVGIVNIHGIPAPQFQAIRKKLWGRATITVAKNNLLRLALEQANAKKPDLVESGETTDGPTAVVTADSNPFRLSKELEATTTRAPPRGGALPDQRDESAAPRESSFGGRQPRGRIGVPDEGNGQAAIGQGPGPDARPRGPGTRCGRRAAPLTNRMMIEQGGEHGWNTSMARWSCTRPASR